MDPDGRQAAGGDGDGAEGRPPGPAVRVTRAQLADGREIVYYDRDSRPRRPPTDGRPPASGPPGGRLRFDVVSGTWVAVAAHRQDRTHRPREGDCPLCPSRPGHPTEIPAADYEVVVFENRFPAFGGPVGGDPVSDPIPLSQGGLALAERAAAGRCEVVSFTAEHHSSFSALSQERVLTVVEAWIDRTRALAAMPAVKQVYCFENRGRDIGVTLSHPHGQIYGYPFVTPRTSAALQRAASYRLDTGRNLFADAVAAEVADGRRVVARTEAWTAFVPFAARWPLEVHLYPNRRVGDLPELQEREKEEFAALYLDVLRRMEAVFDDSLPYVAAWHQAPVGPAGNDAYLHLEVFSIRRGEGRLKYLAGSESGMGAFLNDVEPEAAAAMIRRART